MKTYKVTAHYIVYLQTEVEAENEDQAWSMAQDMGGSMFKAVEADDVRIDDVYEVEE